MKEYTKTMTSRMENKRKRPLRRRVQGAKLSREGESSFGMVKKLGIGCDMLISGQQRRISLLKPRSSKKRISAQ